MPVAPSFKDYKMVTEEPFTKNGKLYVTVEHPNTHNHRDVRWYSQSEFDKAYPAAAKAARQESVKKYGGLKHARGFDNGYVLCVRGNHDDDEPWLINSPARYAMGMRWYFISTEPLPEDLPAHFRLLRITWEEAKLDDEHMKSAEELKAILDGKARRGEWYER